MTATIDRTAAYEASIAQRFAREITDHEMTVLHDDGLYRHLAFQHKNKKYSWNMWFDLITVPGALIFQGDGESFTFRRIEDMFEFFRGPVGTINSGYWAEKLTSSRDSVMRYQQERLQQHINEDVAEAIQNEADCAPEGAELKLDGLVAAVQEEILDELVDDETYDRKLVDDFGYWANPGDRYRQDPDFRFQDSWEWQTSDYDWWFLWALHAIVWGIASYDGRDTAMPESAMVAAQSQPIDALITLTSTPVPVMVTVELPGGELGA